MALKVLIIGSGGREHALAWKAAQSSRVSEVLVAPGNAGTELEPRVRNIEVSAEDIEGLVAAAEHEGVALTIVGPEVPLVKGVVDAFAARGLRCFGPTAEAARLEGSKDFAKAFMARHGIPTADYRTFESLEQAQAYVKERGAPIVVKADGLAAGKGVVVAKTEDEALSALAQMFEKGPARVVIEACLLGEEASFMVVASGREYVPLVSSQDHKARDEGDTGPNTGGMGAYSPAPVVDDAVHERILREVIEPTLQGMVEDGVSFTGFLYAGLMIDETGSPRVLEFNVRMGDPETQPIMCRLESDLIDLCEAALAGDLSQVNLAWTEDTALGVVMAAGGYPGTYQTGSPILGLDHVRDAHVFHAGTRREGDQTVTAGGRVLCVVGTGPSVREAQRTAYAAVERISFQDCYYRRDIGHRAISRD